MSAARRPTPQSIEEPVEGERGRATLRRRLADLYLGRSVAGRRFRLSLIVADFLVVVSVVLASFWPQWWGWTAFYIALAFYVAFEFALRLVAARSWPRALVSIESVADVAVIVAVILPFGLPEAAFLRSLRTIALFRSVETLHDLGRYSAWARRNEHSIAAVLYLAVFIFVVTGLVYTLQHGRNPDIKNYFDALYFTVTALTTTGFGDIVLRDPVGRLLSILIMLLGAGLFINLARALFRPSRREIACGDCGLREHEWDAAHCRRCGAELHASA